jgi:hypothetical protein
MGSVICFGGSVLLRSVLVSITALWIAGCSSNTEFGIAPQDFSFGQQVTYNNKVDVLFVMDNSQTMAKHQSAIGSQFSNFIDVLNQKGIDYHIGVTTMDVSASGARGALLGTVKVIDSRTPNLKNQFLANVNMGETGSDLERGIDGLRRALTAPLIDGANTGFLRTDAVLAIVFVTNEDDKSSGSIAEVIAALDAIKPPFPYGARGWIANLIGVLDVGTDCSTSASYTEPGDRYLALVDRSGGTGASICSNNMSQALANVRQRIAEMMSEYRLGREPIVSTLQVAVNGQLLPNDPVNGWTYVADGYIIRFNGTAVPPAGSDIRIAYQPKSSK